MAEYRIPKEKRNTLITLSLLLLFWTSETKMSAQSTTKKLFYKTYVNREMYKWGDLIRSVETNNPPKTIEQKFELLNYYYGFTGYLMNRKQHETAQIYISKGQDLIDNILDIAPKNPTAYSYKGAFYGFQMGLSKYKSVYLGPKCLVEIHKALKIDQNNVQALVDKGNVYFYSPAVLGGDKEDALQLYIRALNLMERNKETDHNWNYLNLLTTIGIGYTKTAKLNEAKKIYEKILKIEPDFKWVKDDLYPNLIKKM